MQTEHDRELPTELATVSAAELPQVADIGLMAVIQSVERLAREVQGMRSDLGVLVGEIRQGRAAVKADRESGAAERLIISEALVILKEDTDFFQVQAVSALQRLSDKLTAISNMLLHVHSVADSESSREVIIEPRRPRALPVIIRDKRRVS